jgi:hypothetical protein
MVTVRNRLKYDVMTDDYQSAVPVAYSENDQIRGWTYKGDLGALHQELIVFLQFKLNSDYVKFNH